MALTDLDFSVQGKRVTEPREAQKTKITAAFGTNSNQPEIESDRFTLVKDAAQAVINDVAAGNIYDGLDCVWRYRQRNITQGIFEGYIDTSEDYEEVAPSFGSEERPNEVKVKFKGTNTITNFQDKINGVSYGFLYSEGAIKDSDFVTVKTALVKKSNFLEIAIALLTLYILTKQVIDTVREVKKSIAEIIGIATGSVTGGIAAAVYAVTITLLQIAYSIALIAVLIKLVTDLIQLLVPPILKNKGCTLRTLLSRACEHYGYTFVSPITELDLYVYLPTKPFTNSTNIVNKLIPLNVPTKTGIPSSDDYGYIIPQMFQLCKDMFYSMVDVIGNEVHLRNNQDPFWLKTADYTPPIKINFPNKFRNTADLKQTVLDTFTTDPQDLWTTENRTGTSYEIKTSAVNPRNIKHVSIKGLDRTQYQVALPNSKTSLSPIESIMIGVAKVGDTLARAIGQSSNMESGIKRNRINVLKVTDMEYTVPKLVPLAGGQVPPNHRELISAKVLHEKFHQGKSFVTGDKLGQKVIYRNLRLPFTLVDFQKTIKNGNFILPDGRKARFITIPYQFNKDIIEVDIEVQEIYTDKLKETYIEP
jgi:hypothetical protein